MPPESVELQYRKATVFWSRQWHLETGKHKLAHKWEHDPYTVVAQPYADVSVFTVQKANCALREKDLHMNLLLPIEYLTNTEPHIKKKQPVPKPRLRKKQITPVTSITSEGQGVHSHESSSDEVPFELVIVEHDASSDTTFTEERHDDSAVTDTTEDCFSDKDAHSPDVTDREAEVTETRSVIRSASIVRSGQ